MVGDPDAMSELPLPGPRGNLKTYALEVNGVQEVDVAQQRLETLAQRQALHASATEDQSISVIWDSTGSFFVDALTPRFWLFHTFSSAAWAGRVLRRAINESTDLDRCWFPWESLRDLMLKGGRPKWFKSDFLGNDLLPTDNVDARRMRLQLKECRQPSVRGVRG